MVVRAGGDEIPCADYATFGSAQLAVNVVAALAGGDACLMANHGMVALGDDGGDQPARRDVEGGVGDRAGRRHDLDPGAVG